MNCGSMYHGLSFHDRSTSMTDIRTIVAVLLAFTSSFLLFSIQPVVGRIFLPFLGGSPAVWNTCMMFFQTLLLLGYLYSHIVSQKVKPHIQPGWQFIIGALTLFILPIGLPVRCFATFNHEVSHFFARAQGCIIRIFSTKP